MKKILLMLFLAVLVLAALHAQNLTQEEITKAVSYLEKTRDGVVVATAGLSEAQWNFKPATNRWSVAEVTEHIAATEEMLMNLIQQQVMKSPARTNAVDVTAIDSFVLQTMTDRSVKAQAPESLQPDNRFGSPEASLIHFKESRAKTIAFLKDTKDLRQHAMNSPPGKQLDGYEWVRLIAAHSERHTKQINEVKSESNFPKN